MKAKLINAMLSDQIRKLEKEDDLISGKRKQELILLAKEILRQIDKQAISNVIFVCTHNSRRSQLSQLWLYIATIYYGVENVFSFSAGTESTAFNSRMVEAVEAFGFNIKVLKNVDAQNPIYLVNGGPEDGEGMTMFSKKISDPFNPQKDFIAVMVCSQADKDCPFVPGAFSRFSLPYNDPKAYDGTPNEQKAYTDKVREIGREILYMIRMIKMHN